MGIKNVLKNGGGILRAGFIFTFFIFLLKSDVIYSEQIEMSKNNKMVIIKKQDNGKETTVKLGDLIQIQLDTLGSAGYIWQFDNLDNEYFELFAEETKENSKKGFTGAPVLKCWQLKTKKAGESEIRLYHYRVWEGKDKAIDTFLIKVRIIEEVN